MVFNAQPKRTTEGVVTVQMAHERKLTKKTLRGKNVPNKEPHEALTTQIYNAVLREAYEMINGNKHFVIIITANFGYFFSIWKRALIDNIYW